jgi:palmitoyltransferase
MNTNMNNYAKFSQKLKESAPESYSPFENPVEPTPPRVCKRCRTIKPYGTHHCSSCKRCVVRLDHHCPWINNCVAIFNQKYFLLFLIYTAFLCFFSGTLLVARFVSCTNFKTLSRPPSCNVGDIGTFCCIYNFIVALVFGLFVLIMFFDQLSAIFENTPGIDALQQRFGVKKGRYEALCDVFGEKLSWRWFLPFDLPPQGKYLF